jgi:hypothetical protein
MSKKLLGASLVALLFSSVCFANISGDADVIVPAEMQKMVLLCDGHDGEAVVPGDAS